MRVYFREYSFEPTDSAHNVTATCWPAVNIHARHARVHVCGGDWNQEEEATIGRSTSPTGGRITAHSGGGGGGGRGGEGGLVARDPMSGVGGCTASVTRGVRGVRGVRSQLPEVYGVYGVSYLRCTGSTGSVT